MLSVFCGCGFDSHPGHHKKIVKEAQFVVELFVPTHIDNLYGWGVRTTWCRQRKLPSSRSRKKKNKLFFFLTSMTTLSRSTPRVILTKPPIAQLVEQLPLKETVVGSIPSRGTIEKLAFLFAL